MVFTRTNPNPLTLVKNTVTSSAEQKLKLKERGEWLKQMIAKSEHDAEARAGFEQDLENLRSLYKKLLPDSEIIARCEKLAEIKASLRITDNRQAYRRQTDRAVAALCGGAA